MAPDRNEVSWDNSPSCQNQSCCCKKCKRIQKFQKLLDQFRLASEADDYEERIPAMVAMISAVCI